MMISKVFSVHRNDIDVLYVADQYGRSFYLFNTRHSASIHKYFKHGVRYEKAIDFASAKRNFRLCKLMERIPAAVKYIKKEYYSEC